jgi:hypothetical protein
MSQASPTTQPWDGPFLEGAIPRSTLRIPMPAGVKPPRPETTSTAASEPLPKSGA